MRINALCTKSPRTAKKNCDLVVCCCTAPEEHGFTVVNPFSDDVKLGDIYIDTLTDEDVLEKACDYLVSTKDAHAIVRAAYDLNETGLIEARHKLSPIMLLHKMGVLDKCTIAGGVCLDNDDLDLMAQECIPLILLPTASAGYGYGYAPVCAALRRGIRVGVGTFDGKYNKAADLDYEIKFLSLTANAEMRAENALSTSQLNKILAFE